MIRPRKRLVWAFILAILIAVGAMGLKACFGPDTTIFFTWERNPDLPLKKFAAGRIGIIQPFYARSYLVVAYRYLMDKPLTAQEQAEAVDLWDRRLNGGPLTTFDPEESGPAPGSNFLDTPDPDSYSDDDGPANVWIKARSEFMQGPPPELQKEDRRWDRLRWFQNIQGGAFRTALRTLESRSKLWGRRDPRLKAWIQAQDQVFATTQAHPHIPKAIGPDEDPLLTQDRAYQIASAKFYAQRYEEALQDFEAIGRDSQSPWAKVATYMVARTWYRKAQAIEAMEGDHRREATQAYGTALAFAEKLNDFPRAHFFATSLRWEAKQARAREASPDPDEFDTAARFLAKAAAANEHPLERTRELAALLATPSSTEDFGVDLGDYTILMDRQIQQEDAWDWYLHRGFGGKPEKPRSIPKPLLLDDLTDWVFHVRESGPQTYIHAVGRWRERKSLPWLLLALGNAEPSSEGIGDLLEAAASVQPPLPGYPMAAFHRARLLVAMKRPGEARPILDGLIQQGEAITSPSAMNLARAMRLPLARTKDELVDDLLRKVVGVESPLGEEASESSTSGSDISLVTSQSVSVEHRDADQFFRAYGPKPSLLQADGATLINLGLPTSMILDIARSPKTPPHLKREWTRCAWVRSVVLDDLETAVKITPEVQTVEPELIGPLNEFLAASPEDRPNMAAWVLMHHPGLRWYVSQSLSARTYQPTKRGGDYDWMHGYRLKDRHPFRDSFWPRLQDLKDQHWTGFWFGGSNPFAYEESLQRAFGDVRPEAPTFLSGSERAQLAKEVDHLQSLDDGPTWICKRALIWAEALPEDPRIPEVLHFAVRATRIGGATDYSKRCFKLLHRRYPSSPWTRKTPFHF